MFRCWVEVSLRFDFLFLQTFGNPTTRILSVDAGNVVDQLRLERSVDFRALCPQIFRLGDIFAEIEQGKIGILELGGKGRPIRRVIPPDVGPMPIPKVGPKSAQSQPKVGPKSMQRLPKVGPKLVRSWPTSGSKST